MKLELKGFEIIKGDSQKTGKPYDMTRIHVDIPLAESATARGKAGTSYDCPAEILAPILNIKLPAMCEIEIQDVMQWGKRVQRISSITPINSPAPPRCLRCAMAKLLFDINQNNRGTAWVLSMYRNGSLFARASYPLRQFYPTNSSLLTKREAAGIASMQAWNAAYDAGAAFLKMHS